MRFNIDKNPVDLDVCLAAAERVVKSGNFILGQELEAFEGRWANVNRAKHCIGVGNGTDAIRIALLAAGVGPGDEVISPAFGVSYAALAVQSIGAVNKLCEVDPLTMLMDMSSATYAITDRTKAIVPVHLYGLMLDVEMLSAIAKMYGVKVVEDAAQAHGASYFGSPPGSWSDAACFSFYPTKNLGAMGEAGGIVTNDPEIDRQARILRDGGRTDRYVHQRWGLNSTLDEIQAAILHDRCGYLGWMNQRRRALANTYLARLRHLPLGFQLYHDEHARHVYHLFVVTTPHRDALLKHLNDNGVPALIHYPVPINKQPFIEPQGRGFPIAEKLADTVLSLPLYPTMLEEDQEKVILEVERFFQK